MSIGLHHLLRILIQAGLFIAGMAALLLLIDHPLLGVGLMTAGFFAGGLASHWFTRYVPVPCPRCQGKAYAMTTPEGRLVFKCRRCGYVQETGFSESDLSD